MNIRSLTDVPSDELFSAFSSAFADYEMQLNQEQLQTMLNRRGFNPGLSFAAFDRDKIISFCFNGTGLFEGVPTANDTGTGTLKEHRGKGLASEIFRYSLPFLREAGIRQYLLEVMQHNTSAVNLYRKAGFEVSREFNYFVQESGLVSVRDVLSSVNCQIRRIGLNVALAASDFQDFNPSWQNSSDALMRNPESFVVFGAFHDDTLAGYCILEPESGDIPRIAVGRQHRRRGIGSALLAEAMRFNRSKTVKVINTDIKCHNIRCFLDSANIHPAGKQYEMTMII